LKDGCSLASVVSTVIKLADDPIVNVKGACSGVQGITEAASKLAQHTTGVLTMDERPSGDERRGRESTETAIARGELFGNDNS